MGLSQKLKSYVLRLIHGRVYRLHRWQPIRLVKQVDRGLTAVHYNLQRFVVVSFWLLKPLRWLLLVVMLLVWNVGGFKDRLVLGIEVLCVFRELQDWAIGIEDRVVVQSIHNLWRFELVQERGVFVCRDVFVDGPVRRVEDEWRVIKFEWAKIWMLYFLPSSIPSDFSLNILVFFKLKKLNFVNQKLRTILDLIMIIYLRDMPLLKLSINHELHCFHSLLKNLDRGETIFRAKIPGCHIALFILDVFKSLLNHGVWHIHLLSIWFVLVHERFLYLSEILNDPLLVFELTLDLDILTLVRLFAHLHILYILLHHLVFRSELRYFLLYIVLLPLKSLNFIILLMILILRVVWVLLKNPQGLF